MNTSITNRGALIVVEGIDRSGKSTQCKRIVEKLNNNNVKAKLMRFPDRTTEIGKKIDGFLNSEIELDDNEVHLLFSKNRWEKAKEMISDLNNGVTLIIDRYAFSGAAYTGAKEGFTLNWCKQSDSGLPAPDAVLFLDIASDQASQRCDFGKERYEKSEFQNKVYRNFLKLKTDKWIDINASEKMETVTEKMMKNVEETIKSCTNKPIEELWL